MDMLKIQKLLGFCRQVKSEAMKVAWPTKNEVLLSTWVVLLSVLVFSVLCLAVDYTMHLAIQFVLSIGNR